MRKVWFLVLWFGYFPKRLMCQRLGPKLVAPVIWEWLDWKDFDELMDESLDGFKVWWHCWEVVGSSRLGLVRGSKLQRVCLWRVWLVVSPSSYSLDFLAAKSWAALLCHVLSLWCFFLATDLKAMESADHELKSLNLWAKISLSSFNCVSQIFITVMKKNDLRISHVKLKHSNEVQTRKF
jgi:hypothetical protein